VIVKEALANGRLTARGIEEPLLALAARFEVPADAVAIAAALAEPWAAVVLSGASSVEQLRSNLAARSALVGVVELPAEEPEAYWRARGELPWT
jgi:aryl-alcohol dehydrogenase-like predicted oxidoreductase